MRWPESGPRHVHSEVPDSPYNSDVYAISVALRPDIYGVDPDYASPEAPGLLGRMSYIPDIAKTQTYTAKRRVGRAAELQRETNGPNAVAACTPNFDDARLRTA